MPLGEDAADPNERDGPLAYHADEVDRSLVDDVEALIDDGKTYLQAELAFQKSRAALVADGAKSAAVLGALAAVCAVLALVALTIGLLLALTPLITAWGATAVVVGALLLAAFLAVRVAGKRWRNMMSAMSGDSTP